MSDRAILVNKKTGEEKEINAAQGIRIGTTVGYQEGWLQFECMGNNGTCRCKLKYGGRGHKGFSQYNRNYHHAPGCEYDESGKGRKPPREKRIEGLDQTGDSLNIMDIFGQINAGLLANSEHGPGPGPGPKPGPKPPKEPKEGYIKEVYVDRPPRDPQELFDVAINKGLNEVYAGLDISKMIFCKENFDKHVASMKEEQVNMAFCVCKRTMKPKDGTQEIDAIDGMKTLWLRVYAENQKSMYVALKFVHGEEKSDTYNYIMNHKDNRIVVYANDWKLDTIKDLKFLKCTIHKRKKQVFEYDED